jgi:diguanylate cyclase
MRYDESAEKSAEFLRLALPLMARQRAATHPVSYALWYEYVSGANAGLRDAVDACLKAQGSLDEESTLALYRKHIAEIDEELARQLSAGFQKVMTDVSLSATQGPGDRASRFGDSLGRLSAGLKPANAGDGIKSILALTRDMQDSIVALKNQLDESRGEIEQLRKEVTRARTEACTDGLTGLMNRRGFEMTMATCLASHGGADAGPCLLMLDIDHFKKVNDSYGHVFGDKVLRAVAQILHDNVKGKDTAGALWRRGIHCIAAGYPAGGCASACRTDSRRRRTLPHQTQHRPGRRGEYHGVPGRRQLPLR